MIDRRTRNSIHASVITLVALVSVACGSTMGPTNEESLTDFATRYAAAWSSQDPESLASFYAEDGALRVNDGDPAAGRAAIAAKAKEFMDAFPDMVVAMDSVSGEGNHATFHWTWTGTNTGPGGTGRSVRITGYEQWTLDEDGLIAESRGHYDEAEYRRQVNDDPSASDVPASPEDGGPRNWKVTSSEDGLPLREQPSVTATTVASYAPGTILDNLGCRRVEDRVWCDVQELGGGPRGYVAAESLTPARSPDGSVATGPDDSALRVGRGEFDATGTIPCARHLGQPMTRCEFGVARAGGGYATVEIEKPEGGTRVVFFRMGIAIGAGTSEADPGGEFRAAREGDLHIIRVGDERYEISDAVVLGG
jgi:steroid delta-isomerase-like uncharacterized protein